MLVEFIFCVLADHERLFGVKLLISHRQANEPPIVVYNKFLIIMINVVAVRSPN